MAQTGRSGPGFDPGRHAFEVVPAGTTQKPHEVLAVPSAPGSRGAGDDCSDPFVIQIPAGLPYEETGNSTCGHGNVYDTTGSCLGNYDNGEDFVYRLDVTSGITLRLTMTPDDEWTGFAIFNGCPDTSECLAFATYGSAGYVAGPMAIVLTLMPGSYFVMMDSYPSPACYSFDFKMEEIHVIQSFPYHADFEDGSIPVEFYGSSGEESDIRTDGNAACLSSYGLLFEGNTAEGWGATPNTPGEAFAAPKESHIAHVDLFVSPTGHTGSLTMQMELKQGFSYDRRYGWFRILLNGEPLPDEHGYTFYNPLTHSDPFQTRSWDLSPYQNAFFTLTLQSSCKYFENYYQQGDVVFMDDLKIWYEPMAGAMEGYVYNTDGMPVTGANVGIEDQGVTISHTGGYYFLENISAGDHEVSAWKQGYNAISDSVSVVPGSTVTHDPVLTRPEIHASPYQHDITLNPNEYYSTRTRIFNTGSGPLQWQAMIEYLNEGFTSSGEYPRQRGGDRTDLSRTKRDIQQRGAARDLWDVQFDFPVSGGGGEAGVETDGQYIYSTVWDAPGFHKYTLEGSYLGSFSCGNLPGIRDLAYVPSKGYFYGSDASTTVYILDFGNQHTVGTLTAPAACRAIAYDQDQDAFYCNNWSTDIVLFDRTTGAYISGFPTGVYGNYYGFAYDNWTDEGPYLWGFSQDGTGAEIVQMHLPSGAETGFSLDVLSLTGGTQNAGGLFTQPDIYPGTVTIGGLLQNERIFGLELDGGSIQWLSMSSLHGSVPPDGGMQEVPTGFDATGTSSGQTYYATINFSSVPDVGNVSIPCTLRVAGHTLPLPEDLATLVLDDTLGIAKISWACNGKDDPLFYVFRDGDSVGETHDTYFIDTLPAHGSYCYEVTAMYGAGTTAPAGPECLDWPDPILFLQPDTVTARAWTGGEALVNVDVHNMGTGSLHFNFPGFSKNRHHPLNTFLQEVDPASGMVQGPGQKKIAVLYNASGFEPGEYTQSLVCASNDPGNPSDTVIHIMKVEEPAFIAGVITDANSGQPVGGASVTAGAWKSFTSDDGGYGLKVLGGSFDVVVEKLGYQTAVVADTGVLSGDTMYVDKAILEAPYPPASVHATVNGQDTGCMIRWGLPLGPYEIIYDDGSAEELVVWANPGNENAVKFTPSGYPAAVTGGRIYTGDGSFPPGSWLNSTFAVIAYDDNGVDGLPGSPLDTAWVVTGNYGWVDFGGLDVVIPEGDFYISMLQLNSSPGAAPLGVDYTLPVVYRSYSRFNGSEWKLSPYQDFMIRVFIEGPVSLQSMQDETLMAHPPKIPEGLEGTVFFSKNGTRFNGVPGKEKKGRAVPLEAADDGVRNAISYELARVNGFDPVAGPASGQDTILAQDLQDLFYTDTSFGGLPEGWYAYAVRALYGSGEFSEWSYSNIAGRLKDVPVQFNVAFSTGQPAQGAGITLTGEVFPFNEYHILTAANGTGISDSIIKGIYSIDIYHKGYELYEMTVDIQQDTIMDVVLQEKKYAPTNLFVDPLSGIATWEWPLVTELYEDFEGNFPPQGWQSVSRGQGWFATGNASSYHWTVPPADSKYACSNDDRGGGSVNNGCCDYLITPPVDLSGTDEFVLRFDSFYNGAYGQLAYVKYTFDPENPLWEYLFVMPPVSNQWEHIEIDLSEFSGANSSGPVWFAFHSDDDGRWGSGWAIDNVEISNGNAAVIDFHVFLDGAFAGNSDTLWYSFPYLDYGVEYTASVAARYSSGLSEKRHYSFVSEYLEPPRKLDGVAFDDAAHLWWEPPLVPGSFMLLEETSRTCRPNPATEYSPVVRQIRAVNNNGMRDQWDVQFNFPVAVANGEAGLETDGEFIYSTKWDGASFYKYSLDGMYLGEFVIAGVSNIRDLAYNPATGYMYGGNATTSCFVLDFESQTLVSSFTAPTEIRAIAYDDQEDAYWANNWSSDITLFSGGGTLLGSFPVGTYGSFYGFAYDPWSGGGPYLWGFSQDGSGAVFVQTDIQTGNQVFSLDIIGLLGGTEVAGGLFTECGLVEDSIVTIGGMLQNESIFGLELGQCSPSAPSGVVPDNLAGYNVYRDTEKIAQLEYDGSDTSHFFDLELPPGAYEYHVTGLYDLTPYGLPGDTGESAKGDPLCLNVRYGYPLPFKETWHGGSFDPNLWQHEGNWRINGQAGVPGPSAEFGWDPVLTNYKKTLTSYPLDGINLASPFIDGCIWLEFKVKLDSRVPTGSEALRVDIGNEEGWHTLHTFDNQQGNMDWEFHRFDITSPAFGQIFRLRFIAHGVHSGNILSWFVDNIKVYRTCPSPRDLKARATQDHEVLLSWSSPRVCGAGDHTYLKWDNGIPEGGFGIAGGGTFSVASRWSSPMLGPFEDMFITHIRFVPWENSAFVLKIWKGPGADTLICEQAVAGPIPGKWNEIELNAMVPLDISVDLWFGYTVTHEAGIIPAGHDAGPAIAGFGDMVSFDGVNWAPMSANGPSYDKNWSLCARLESLDRNTSRDVRDLQGYNVYRDQEPIAYTQDTIYTDMVGQNGVYTYGVEAVFEDCKSDTLTHAEVNVAVGYNEPSPSNIEIFPNPVTDRLTLRGNEKILHVTLTNTSGQSVYDESGLENHELTIDLSGWDSGIYYLQAETSHTWIVEKIIVLNK
ncbi:MAG: T9SS type A sorting domain-containing protein [Bacteroidales bacterium]